MTFFFFLNQVTRQCMLGKGFGCFLAENRMGRKELWRTSKLVELVASFLLSLSLVVERLAGAP